MQEIEKFFPVNCRVFDVRELKYAIWISRSKGSCHDNQI